MTVSSYFFRLYNFIVLFLHPSPWKKETEKEGRREEEGSNTEKEGVCHFYDFLELSYLGPFYLAITEISKTEKMTKKIYLLSPWFWCLQAQSTALTRGGNRAPPDPMEEDRRREVPEGKRGKECDSSDLVIVSPSYCGGFNLITSLNSTYLPNVLPQCMNLGIKFPTQAFRVHI